MKLIISIAMVVLVATAVAAAVRPSGLNPHGYESLNNEMKGKNSFENKLVERANYYSDYAYVLLLLCR